MIAETVVAYATAIAERVGDHAAVAWGRPEVVTGPAVWVTFAGLSWRGGAYRIACTASCLAPDGLVPPADQAWCWALADQCTDAARALGAAEGLTATLARAELASGVWPTVEVTAPIPVSQCAPTALVPLTQGVPDPWLTRPSSSSPTPR